VKLRSRFDAVPRRQTQMRVLGAESRWSTWAAGAVRSGAQHAAGHTPASNAGGIEWSGSNRSSWRSNGSGRPRPHHLLFTVSVLGVVSRTGSNIWRACASRSGAALSTTELDRLVEPLNGVVEAARRRLQRL